MPSAYKVPTVTLSATPASALDADLVVVPAFAGDELTDEPDLDRVSGGEVSRARERGALTGKLYETFVVSTRGGWTAPDVLLVGAGERARLTSDHLRRIATMGGLAARQRRLTRVAIVLRASPVPPLDAVQAMTEGLVIASYDGATRKTSGPPLVWLERAELRVMDAPAEAARALEQGRILGEYTNEARVLANMPGNELTPQTFADRARQMAQAVGLPVEVLDETRIAELRMGLLLGVARGSQEPPRVVVMRHEPAGAQAGVTLALVGKGITFDTGGISIKPADNMDKMKDDMSGGAAVIGAMAAIARLEAPIRCLGVIPMTENMPSGTAIKPGDVLTSASGKTVEILNTDAEGRLVLGDAIWYARELGATHLVDVATLTGACVVALGKTTSGLFGTPSAWVETLRAASDRAGDRSWPMPVFEDYKEQLKSEIADFSNTGGRPAGAITGALFISEFTGGLPWVHMDIAGTAWAEESKPYQPKGATGVAVRTLAELALDSRAWSGRAFDAGLTPARGV
jgi:leucyl aminopeptidase